MQYPDYDATADIEVINVNIKKLVQNAEEQDTQIKSKEPNITKKTGFNLDKTDLTENDSNKLFSAKGALNLFNTLTTNFTNSLNIVKEALRGDIVKKLDKSTYPGNAQNLKNDIDGKEPVFSKNSAFNKSFGIANNEVLEGAKLAETLGIEYAGILNNNSTKATGKAYYCTANKSIYKCIANTTLNYADAGHFIAISNDDLLGKLQNLSIRNNIEIVASTNIPNGVLQIIRTRMGNIAYFTAMATTNNSTFEHIKVDFKDMYCRYRVLSSTSYAEDGNDLSIGLTGDESNSNIVTASIRRMGGNQPPAMVCKVMLICEIL